MKFKQIIGVVAFQAVMLLANETYAIGASSTPACSSAKNLASTIAKGKCQVSSYFVNNFSTKTTGCDLEDLNEAVGQCYGGNWKRALTANPNFKGGFCARAEDDLCTNADAAAACGIDCPSDDNGDDSGN